MIGPKMVLENRLQRSKLWTCQESIKNKVLNLVPDEERGPQDFVTFTVNAVTARMNVQLSRDFGSRVGASQNIKIFKDKVRATI